MKPCNETEFVFDSHIFVVNENNYVKCAFCSTYFRYIIIHLVRSSKCKQYIINFSLFKQRLKELYLKTKHGKWKLVVKKKKKLITVEVCNGTEFVFDSHIFEVNENNYVKCAFCSCIIGVKTAESTSDMDRGLSDQPLVNNEDEVCEVMVIGEVNCHQQQHTLFALREHRKWGKFKNQNVLVIFLSKCT